MKNPMEGGELLENRVEIAANRLRELLETLNRLSLPKPKGVLAPAFPRGAMRATYRKQMVEARDHLVEVLNDFPEGDEKVEYLKLIVDCDSHLNEEDKTREA